VRCCYRDLVDWLVFLRGCERWEIVVWIKYWWSFVIKAEEFGLVLVYALVRRLCFDFGVGGQFLYFLLGVPAL